MNHLYHSLSPLILLAAFLVSLLAFLAPTPILSDRVSLLEVSTNVSSSINVKRWYAEDDSVALAYSAHRFVRRAKKANASSSSAAAATTVPVTVKIGPLGPSRSRTSDEAGSELTRRWLSLQVPASPTSRRHTSPA